jgi:dienelactone hydrolase
MTAGEPIPVAKNDCTSAESHHFGITGAIPQHCLSGSWNRFFAQGPHCVAGGRVRIPLSRTWDQRLFMDLRMTEPRRMFSTRISSLFLSIAVLKCAAAEKPFMSFYNPPPVPIPLEEHHSYESAVMQTKVGYNIYLPPDYSASGNTNRYPVIYWLHGRGCSESNDQFPASIVDDAIRSNAIPPLIFVYASGGAMSFYSDSANGEWMAETTIIKELIPHIDATYRTVPNRGGRAIQGMSMGGFGAMKLALKYPELFSSVVAFAGGYRDAQSIQSDDISREILERVFDGDPQRFMANHPATFARAGAENSRARRD